MPDPKVDIERRIMHEHKAERAAAEARIAYFAGLSRRELQNLDHDYHHEVWDREHDRPATAVREAMKRRQIPEKR